MKGNPIHTFMHKIINNTINHIAGRDRETNFHERCNYSSLVEIRSPRVRKGTLVILWFGRAGGRACARVPLRSCDFLFGFDFVCHLIWSKIGLATEGLMILCLQVATVGLMILYHPAAANPKTTLRDLVILRDLANACHSSKKPRSGLKKGILPT